MAYQFYLRYLEVLDLNIEWMNTFSLIMGFGFQWTGGVGIFLFTFKYHEMSLTIPLIFDKMKLKVLYIKYKTEVNQCKENQITQNMLFNVKIDSCIVEYQADLEKRFNNEVTAIDDKIRSRRTCLNIVKVVMFIVQSTLLLVVYLFFWDAPDLEYYVATLSQAIFFSSLTII